MADQVRELTQLDLAIRRYVPGLCKSECIWCCATIVLLKMHVTWVLYRPTLSAVGPAGDGEGTYSTL